MKKFCILVFVLAIFVCLLGCNCKIILPLDNTLKGLIEAEKQGEEEAYALKYNLHIVDGCVRVMIHPVIDEIEKATTEIERYGTISYISESESRVIAATVPINRLETLARNSSIRLIRAPTVPQPGENY